MSDLKIEKMPLIYYTRACECLKQDAERDIHPKDCHLFSLMCLQCLPLAVVLVATFSCPCQVLNTFVKENLGPEASRQSSLVCHQKSSPAASLWPSSCDLSRALK